jgi:hypothetical protein
MSSSERKNKRLFSRQRKKPASTNGVSSIIADGRTIISIDYSGMKEKEMILLVDQLKILLRNLNQPQLILSVYYDKNYAIPSYMKHVTKAPGKLFI